jgi:hypothetical protein
MTRPLDPRILDVDLRVRDFLVSRGTRQIIDTETLPSGPAVKYTPRNADAATVMIAGLGDEVNVSLPSDSFESSDFSDGRGDSVTWAVDLIMNVARFGVATVGRRQGISIGRRGRTVVLEAGGLPSDIDESMFIVLNSWSPW